MNASSFRDALGQHVQPLTREQLAAARFRHATGAIQVRETHLSYVVLTGSIAYKIKKAVALDFIDTTSLERRRQLCEDELRLNRRYASDLYLRVVPITLHAGTLHFDGTGPAIEYAVAMRQFDPGDELDALLRADAVNESDLAALADCIADFHRRASPLDAPDGRGTQAFVRKARENIASLSGRIDAVRDETDVTRLEHWTETVLAQEAARLEARERNGFVRECHGDLHCGNVVRWRGALVPFDCIEFDPELRFIDVINDVAFLAMDLIAKQRGDLAATLLNRYLERTGDYAGIALLPCYVVYRALVRTKVELIALEQRPKAVEHGERASAYLQAAVSFAYPRRKPTLIIMHGASGSGKSWLSARLVAKLPAIRVRSDLERKRLAGLDAFDHGAASDPRIYTLEFNDRTYAHLSDCARDCLYGGTSVIVDAAFLKARERDAFRALAQSLNVPFAIVSCSADPETLAARIASRRDARNDPSDADEDVMRRQLETMERLSDEERAYVIEIDTRNDDALEHVLSEVKRVSTR
ncbi:MAG: AAA family ATPase [Xanthomonadaceae bacterium]|nr:AAA family ATPase [Xanthomonadaceae bacterium]